MAELGKSYSKELKGICEEQIVLECESRSRQPEASPDIQEIDFNPESPHEGNLNLKVRMKAIYFLKVRMKAIFIIGAYAHSFSQRCLQDMF